MKRQHGAYYTENSPFELKPFKNWAISANISQHTILEPFAGANNIIRMLKNLGMCSKFVSFDICPAHHNVKQFNTLKQFPVGYKICITNPPWLARNSAHRRKLVFPAPVQYDDVYQYALEIALKYCEYVAFIIPATFLRSGLFRKRLESFVLIERPLFYDTDNPVCLAMFTPNAARTQIWAENKFINYLDSLEMIYNKHAHNTDKTVRFNAPDGELGLLGVDNTKDASIRFCHGSELSHRVVVHSDRSITRIDPGIKVTSDLIDSLNETLNKFRNDTYDLFLAPFKGLRADGKYRRRLDYATARGLIAKHLK